MDIRDVAYVLILAPFVYDLAHLVSFYMIDDWARVILDLALSLE